MKKKYVIRGMMESHPLFRAGRTRIQVAFTGGHLCNGGTTPAQFETADAVIQRVIEDSLLFKSGKIILDSEEPDSGDGIPAHTDRDGKKRSFGSFQAAQDWLRFQHRLPLTAILTPDDLLREARILGLEIEITDSKKD